MAYGHKYLLNEATSMPCKKDSGNSSLWASGESEQILKFLSG